MADADEQVDDTQDSPLLRDLRKQLKEANKELGELRQFRTERVMQKAGFDPDSKVGKALMRLHEGDLTEDGLRATAEEYGFEPAAEQAPVDEAAQERSETIARVDDLRVNATPVGSQSVPYSEYQQLSQVNPGEAAKLLQAGKVADLPPFVAQSIAANRAERANTFGA